MTIALAQSVVATTDLNTSSITVNFGSNTTVGNALFMLFSSSGSFQTISSVKIGGNTDNWADLADDPGGQTPRVHIWADFNCQTAAKAVLISGSGFQCGPNAGGIAIMEFSGLKSTAAAALDQQSGQNAGSSGSGNWSSGTTPTTTQANELYLGVCNTGFTAITGEPSAYTNFVPGTRASFGYQIVSATGTTVYNGTPSCTVYAALVVTLKAAAAGGNQLLAAFP